MRPSESLKQRYISEEANHAAWIEYNADYWRYPVFGLDKKVIAYRVKRYPDSKLEKKYGWSPSKPAKLEAQWYILPDTIGFIKDAGGIAMLANGEPAMLAYRAAGFKNAIATTLSEIAVPQDAANYLLSIGVSQLIYVIDKDEAGLQSAQNWFDALSGSGIDIVIRAWPDYLPDKADANDALICAKGDKSGFLRIITETAIIPLTKSPEKAKPKYTAPQDIDFTEARNRLAQDVLDRLSAKGYLTGKRYGAFYQTICLHHEEREASAGIDPLTGVMNCFRCGKHGLHENAKALGMHIEDYYPKREDKKKPKKDDLRRFRQEIETPIETPSLIDNRSYEEAILDEMNARLQAYEAKQFVGVGAWKALPLSILSAVMTLTNGRSNTALFLAKLQEALIAGKLPSVFNREMLQKALGLSYQIVFRGVFELEHMNFLRKLSGIIYSIDSLSQVSEENGAGRPQDWFMLELEAGEIKAHLSKMLEIYTLEHVSRKALAMPSMQMARQMGLNEPEYIAWRDKVKLALEDKSNKAAKRAFDAEMFGNGTTWRGWIAALESPFAIPLTCIDCETSLDLRASLLRYWVSHIRAINSRDELCRLLGCSDGALDNILDKANLVSERRQQKVEFNTPKTVQQMSYEWSKNQRDLRGKCWKAGFWVTGENGWIPVDESNYLEVFANYAGKVHKVYMLIVTPSAQRPMNELEIAERDARLAEEAAKQEAVTAPNVVQGEEKAPEKSAKTSAAKKGYSYLKWDKHSYAFLYRQLQLLVHCFTDCRLEQNVIFDKKGQGIASGQLPELMRWFGENAKSQPSRSIRSFYGKDYDEELDLKALQELAERNKAKLGIIESQDWDESVDDLPIFQESLWR